MKALVLVFAVFLAGGIEAPPQGADYCEVDADCAPAQCCHPENTVNKRFAPNCEEAICTAVCAGSLDCAAGEIKCVENKCVIVPRE